MRPHKPPTRGTDRLGTLAAVFIAAAFIVAYVTNGNFYACLAVFAIGAIVIFFGWTQDWYMDQRRSSGPSRRRKARKERKRREHEERERLALEAGHDGLTVKEPEAKELK